MSETNVGANLMFALRTKTKNEPISKKQCIYKKMTGQKRLLEDAFIRLEAPAKQFYEGLEQTL